MQFAGEGEQASPFMQCNLWLENRPEQKSPLPKFPDELPKWGEMKAWTIATAIKIRGENIGF